MYRYQLPLQVRGKLSDLHTALGAYTFQFITVSLTFGSKCQIDQAGLPGGHLYTLVTQASSPA